MDYHASVLMGERRSALRASWKAGVAILLAVSVVTASEAQGDLVQEVQNLERRVQHLHHQGRSIEAIPLATRLLEINDSVLGSEHPNTALAISNLGELYRAIADYDTAEIMLKRALAIREKVLGPAHSDTIDSLDDLARLYYAKGVYAKAEPLYQRVVEWNEQMLGPEHPVTARSLNDLAALSHARGAYGKAETLYIRALEIRKKTLAQDHPAIAQSLSNLAAVYQETGAFAKAEPLLHSALAIKERVHGPEHAETATSLNNLAALYHATGAYTKAQDLYQRALAIREKVFGSHHPETVQGLNNLASLYQEIGEAATARMLSQRALAISEKVLGPEHPTTAISLDNLAAIYKSAGNYAEAEPLYRRALGIREKALGSDHPRTAASVNNLAQLYHSIGAYGRAEPLLQRGLLIKEKALGREHPGVAISLNNLAELYRDIGLYSKAKPLYQRALAINEKVLGLEHPDTAIAVSNLALLYRAEGEYTKAEPLLQRSLAIIEKTKGATHPDTAIALNNLAIIYTDTGAHAKADPLLWRALGIREKALGAKHPLTATSLNSLAGLHQSAGAYAEALSLYERALAVREAALGPDHPETGETLNNLGVLHEHLGAYGKAEVTHKRALAIREKALGPVHPATATSLSNLASLHQNIGAYAKAEQGYRRALSIRENVLGPEHADTADLLNNLATLKWAAGDLVTALSLLDRAQNIKERNAERFLLFGSEQRKYAYMSKLAADAFARVSFSVLVPDGQSVALGLTSVLQYKGRVLDAMSGQVARLRQSVRPEDSALFEQFEDVANQLSTLTFQGPGKLLPGKHRQRFAELTRQQEALETELARRSAEFGRQMAPTTLMRIREAIPPGAVLMEWFRYRPFNPTAPNESARWGKPRYVAYLLTRDAGPAVFDIGPAEGIERLTREFLGALSDPRRTDTKELAEDISELLWKPLHRAVGEAERLLVSPDGPLNLVPFAALLDEHGEYLAKRFEITYVTSGRDVTRLASDSTARGDAVIIANPDYGKHMGVTDDMFMQLPGTAAEARALSELLKLHDPSLLLQADATESNVKRLHGPRILHIATHGFFLRGRQPAESPLDVENPLLRSGLALAGANSRESGSSDDGILTALEVAHLDLRGTELVVLSACETGVGEVENGGGVYGLRRALVLAGAQTQVTSLWKVADDATKDLMVDYYGRLLRAEGRSAALREVQKKLIASDDRWHPYYWAAFVPIGNWAPMSAVP